MYRPWHFHTTQRPRPTPDYVAERKRMIHCCKEYRAFVGLEMTMGSIEDTAKAYGIKTVGLGIYKARRCREGSPAND